jgi:phosphoenolpyruvate carboxykinase (GTP)
MVLATAGNALLGVRFALRTVIQHGRDEGWLAEHMLDFGVTTPQGKNTMYGIPSPAAKPTLRMLYPTGIDGWKVTTQYTHDIA